MPENENTRAPTASRLDCHVHLAGVGAGGTRCYFDSTRMRSVAFRLMRCTLGITRAQAETNLDTHLLTQLENHLTAAPELNIVLLAMDWTRDDDGSIRHDLTDLHVPNDYVLSIASRLKQVRAGVSIHPRRPDALAELRRCHAAGAALLKWLPVSQNIAPDDLRNREFFAELATLQMPLLSHTGSEGATRNINKAFNDPKLLLPALDAGVRVIAAHCGMRSFIHDKDYLNDWVAMLKDYPHLYGDTAAWFSIRARNGFRALDREHVVDRLWHGSDWPVPNSPWWYVGILPLKKIRELAAIKNPLTRNLATHRAIGLPDAVFSRGLALLA